MCNHVDSAKGFGGWSYKGELLFEVEGHRELLSGGNKGELTENKGCGTGLTSTTLDKSRNLSQASAPAGTKPDCEDVEA